MVAIAEIGLSPCVPNEMIDACSKIGVPCKYGNKEGDPLSVFVIELDKPPCL